MRKIYNSSMKKYIKVYDDVLPEYQCNALIEKFEVNKDQHVSTVDHRLLQKLILINIKIFIVW